MKVWKRLALFAALLLIGGIFTVQASGYFYRFTPPPTPVTCDYSYLGKPTAHNVTTPVDWNLPVGASFIAYSVKNGTATFSGNYSAPSGIGSQLYAPFSVVNDTFPFSGGIRYDTIVNGQVVYRSSLIFSCDGPGAGTVTLTNGVPSGGGSAISDGRINPENYAPVALYCDGSALTAYAIDAAGQGTQAWSLDLSKAPSGSPLASANGIALSMTGDGRYSVLAPQQDGKQYLFVFDGCPAPGATETYVSDPATGQFVRTE